MHITLYTIQDAEVLKEIETKGFYLNENRILYDSFTQAYDWLARQNKKRKWATDRPIWLWNKKPDLRQERFYYDHTLPDKKEMVLIQVKVLKADCVFMDYGSWHSVLNGMYHDETPGSKVFDAFYARHEKKDGSLTKEGLKLLESSWLRCLNPKPKDTVQVLIEKISKQDIISVKKFMAKNKFIID